MKPPNQPIHSIVSRQMSWLAFNERVLQQATDKLIPLAERLRFLGIFSSNQDEFFKVQLAHIQRRVRLKQDGHLEVEKKLRQIQAKVQNLSAQFIACYRDIVEQYRNEGIHFVYASDLTEKQDQWLSKYFRNKILPYIVPIFINNKLDLATYLEDGRSYLIVKIEQQDDSHIALIDLPDKVERFVEIPVTANQHQDSVFIVIDEVIRHSLLTIFGGYFNVVNIEAWSMKISRDADFEMQSHDYSNLMDHLSKNIQNRQIGEPVRISFDEDMPNEIIEVISKGLKLDNLDCFIAGGRYRNFKDFMSFPTIRSKFSFPKFEAIQSNKFISHRNVFEAISKGNILLIYPYYSFNHFIEFVRQSASDPKVSAIYINVYRIAKYSNIIESLIDASINGKQVTVNVEVRARFDEERNISLVQRLISNGVQVTTGIPTLKVHCKICLVERVEDGRIVRYSNVSTGNFNEETVKVYSDVSLFTKEADLCNELKKVFQFIGHPYLQFDFKHLIVSPLNSYHKLLDLIEHQISLAKASKKACITIKVNNLTDKKLIEALINAANNGVKVRLIVRTVSKLVQFNRDNHPNLRVISIVGRFLEHARIYWFGVDATGPLYISSADIMERNLKERVEVAVPIREPKNKKILIHFLESQLADTKNARILEHSLQNYLVTDSAKKLSNSHVEMYEWLKSIEQQNIATI